METPNQMICGLGGFLLAVFLMAILADLTYLAAMRHPGVNDYVVPLGSGVFLFLWWASYIALCRWRGRRRK